MYLLNESPAQKLKLLKTNNKTDSMWNKGQ